MSENTCQQFSLQPHTSAALCPPLCIHGCWRTKRYQRKEEPGQVKGEPFFLEWLQHSSWKEDTKLESKVICFQSVLPVRIKPTPNPCGLFFLGYKRGGQQLAQLVPNPRAPRVHSTFLLLMQNSSTPNKEDLCHLANTERCKMFINTAFHTSQTLFDIHYQYLGERMKARKTS